MSSLLKFIPFINSCLRRSSTYHQSRLIAHSPTNSKKDIFKSNAYTNYTIKAIYLSPRRDSDPYAPCGASVFKTELYTSFNTRGLISSLTTCLGHLHKKFSYHTCFYTSQLKAHDLSSHIGENTYRFYKGLPPHIL